MEIIAEKMSGIRKIAICSFPGIIFDFGQVVSGTRDVFYVRRKVDLMKTAKVNAYIMHIFEKIELLSIHAT